MSTIHITTWDQEIRLYAIEKQINQIRPEEINEQSYAEYRYQQRQEKSRLIIDKLYDWLMQTR